MIRTVRLALLCLACCGGAVAISVGKTPAPAIVDAGPDQAPEPTVRDTTVDIVQDTLTDADKLNVAYVRNFDEVKPVPPVAVAPVAVASDQPKSIAKSIDRSHDGKPKGVAPPSPSRQSKAKTVKKRTNIAHATTNTDAKPCRRPEGFAGFLRLFNVGPQCAA